MTDRQPQRIVIAAIDDAIIDAALLYRDALSESHDGRILSIVDVSRAVAPGQSPTDSRGVYRVVLDPGVPMIADAPLRASALLAEWESGWQCVFDALSSLTDAELQETIYIREEPHTIYRAIVRQIVHYAGHAYQILALGKHLKGSGWRSLSIPRGKSDEVNQRMLAEQRARR